MLKWFLTGVVASFMVVGSLSASLFGSNGGCPYDWNGFYVGVIGGGIWEEAHTDFEPLPDPVTFGILGQRLRVHPEGGFGGGEIGYNYQMDDFVVGLELDFVGSSLSRSTNGPVLDLTGTPIAGSFLFTSTSLDWFGSFRARLGYAIMDRILAFATGGVSWGHFQHRGLLSFPGVAYFRSTTSTHVGWTAGAGIEYGLTRNWTLKAEYQYIDFGSRSVVADPSVPVGTQIRNRFDSHDNLLRFGINYKLGPC